MKICKECKQEKDLSDFSNEKRNRDGHSVYCKVCYKKRYHKPFGYQTKYNYRTRYGITPKDFDKMFLEQNGCCAICGRHQSEFKRKLSVDHNHETGKVRGLLCHHCNNAIGNAFDNKEILLKAVAYLERF